METLQQNSVGPWKCTAVQKSLCSGYFDVFCAMCSSLKINLPVCCIYQTRWQWVSLCHNCTKHIQCSGNRSEAFLTNPFTNILSMRTCSHQPLWFQALTGCFCMWLQFFLAAVPDIRPSAQNKECTPIMKHISTNKHKANHINNGRWKGEGRRKTDTWKTEKVKWWNKRRTEQCVTASRPQQRGGGGGGLPILCTVMSIKSRGERSGPFPKNHHRWFSFVAHTRWFQEQHKQPCQTQKRRREAVTIFFHPRCSKQMQIPTESPS